MDRTYFYIGVAAVLVILTGIVIYYKWNSKKEHFRLLGTIAPYQEAYYECTSQCERADAGTKPSNVHGSAYCQQYCDYTVGKMATDKPILVVTNPNGDPSPKIKKVKTSIDEAYEVCGDGGSAEAIKCRSDYHTESEIDEKCRQDCKYFENGYPIGSTNYNKNSSEINDLQHIKNMKVCMTQCKTAHDVNKSLGWNWK